MPRPSPSTELALSQAQNRLQDSDHAQLRHNQHRLRRARDGAGGGRRARGADRPAVGARHAVDSLYVRGEQAHASGSKPTPPAAACTSPGADGKARRTRLRSACSCASSIGGAWLEGIDRPQGMGERIVCLHFASPEGGRRYRLMVELMGRHGNQILIDETDIHSRLREARHPADEPLPRNPRRPELLPAAAPEPEPSATCSRPARATTCPEQSFATPAEAEQLGRGHLLRSQPA